MKKIIALLMAAALVISVFTAAALAEENTAADGTSSATPGIQSGVGGRRQAPGSGRMPQTPGRENQDGANSNQMPMRPGKGGGNFRQGIGSGGQNSQVPNGRGGKLGRHLNLDQLLADGVITQETYDAINAWLQARAQAASAPADTDGAPMQPDNAAPAEGAEPPALPEEAPEASVEAQEQLLKSLLDSGAITQEQYDLLVSGLRPVPADQSET